MQPTTTKPKCPSTTKQGTPCNGRYLVDGTYCRFHSPLPEWVNVRAATAALGGSQPKKVLKLNKANFKARDASDIKKLAGKFLEDVAQGKLEISSTVIRTLPQMMKVFLEANKDTTEKRIEKLEQALKSQQQKK